MTVNADSRKKFGEFLRNIRKDRKMSLRAVQGLTGISNAYLSQIETGKRNIPSFSLLVKLEKVYGIEAKTLLEMAMTLGAYDKAAEVYAKRSAFIHDLEKVSSPDADFIKRHYEELSKEGKKQLKDYLLFLVEKEKTTSR